VTEKAEIGRVAAEAREKAESEAAERAKAWTEAKAKEEAEIARLADEASEKVEAKAEARVTQKAFAAKTAAEEAAAEIRLVDAERAKRERE